MNQDTKISTRQKLRKFFCKFVRNQLSKHGYVELSRVSELKKKLNEKEGTLGRLQGIHSKVIDENSSLSKEKRALSERIARTEEIEYVLKQCPLELAVPVEKFVSMDVLLRSAEFSKSALKPVARSITPYELRYPRNFNCTALWGLYWAVAHSCAAAVNSTRNMTTEDGSSREFISVFDKQLKELAEKQSVIGLHVGALEIHQSTAPALKESDVGADILLVVAGNELLPSGGIRAFWIQAKSASGGEPYMLDFWREKNADGMTQYEKLRKMNSPDHGAVALYMQYHCCPR